PRWWRPAPTWDPRPACNWSSRTSRRPARNWPNGASMLPRCRYWTPPGTAGSTSSSTIPTATTGPSRKSGSTSAPNWVRDRNRVPGPARSRDRGFRSPAQGHAAVEPPRAIAVGEVRVLGLPVAHVTQVTGNLRTARRHQLHAVKEPFHVGPGAKVHLLGGAGEDAAEFADRTGWFVVAGEVGQGDVAARCQHIQILGHQAPRVAFVRHEMHHSGHQQAGRLGEVD